MLYRPGIKPLTSLERFSKTSTSSSVETRRNGLMKPQKAQLPTVCVSMFCGKEHAHTNSMSMYFTTVPCTCAPASTTAHQEWVCDED